MSKPPEIQITFYIDGRIKESNILANTVEDRDTALKKLRQILPALELVEGILRDGTGVSETTAPTGVGL